MSDPDPRLVTALAALEQALVVPEGPAGGGHRAKRPLPESWKEDPVKALIAMLLARPDREGVEVALAWFYGRGLPDPTPQPEPGAMMDVGAVVLDVLRRAVEADGIETVRRRFYAAFGEGEGD